MRKRAPRKRKPSPMPTSSRHGMQPAPLLSLPLDVLNPILELHFPRSQWSTAQIHAPEFRQRALLRRVCKLLNKHIVATCTSLAMPLEPRLRKYVDESECPPDDHFLKRVDHINAAPPNLRSLALSTNNRVVADFFSVTLPELIVVPRFGVPDGGVPVPQKEKDKWRPSFLTESILAAKSISLRPLLIHSVHRHPLAKQRPVAVPLVDPAPERNDNLLSPPHLRASAAFTPVPPAGRDRPHPGAPLPPRPLVNCSSPRLGIPPARPLAAGVQTAEHAHPRSLHLARHAAGAFPPDDHFQPRFDLATAAPPNLRRLALGTNNLVAAGLFPVTLSELVIGVSGGGHGRGLRFEEGILVRLRRLPGLERVAIRGFPHTLFGDGLAAKAWAWSSLTTYLQLCVTECMRSDGFRFAGHPTTLQRLELDEGEFVRIGNEMLPAFGSLEVLLLVADGYTMESMALLKNLCDTGRLPLLIELGIGCCALDAEERSGPSLSTALETLLRYLQPTCRKLTIGRHCSPAFNHGDYHLRPRFRRFFDLKLAALPGKLMAFSACSSVRLIPSRSQSTFPPFLDTLGMCDQGENTVLLIRALPKDLRELSLVGWSFLNGPPIPPLLIPSSLKTLTLGAYPTFYKKDVPEVIKGIYPAVHTKDICTIISSLLSLSTLNFISGVEPLDISGSFYSNRHPWEEIHAPYDCRAVTDDVALALPPSLRTLNIHGLHRISPPRIAALRARGVQVFMASESRQARRFFWAYEREPLYEDESDYDLVKNSVSFVNVDWNLPCTDEEMLRWFDEVPHKEEDLPWIFAREASDYDWQEEQENGDVDGDEGDWEEEDQGAGEDDGGE
ncbi:hypothetical protein BDK51DRAFT_48209 [Blyttiomyces helicus]|uniref:Uncharacterized protein n=1 Tax=Blyttiomyces helicus TaxID=388810 RepID=A0A4P9W876_9FUNG|nr:hypothetical protein BDK51DRAFT_48209 [Blyttiomyces helicus]|eukprot:RKO87643.1 hypothetical protein BDK51DRAFT_48209 [Blyttiomyces helicus]